jgi:adenine deaminase
LLRKGYMEFVVQKAIDCGFNPIQAIQMATINVAEHFRLDDIIGGIAPGKYADLVIVSDLKTIKAEYVISKGKIIAKQGDLLVSPRRHTFSAQSLNSIRFSRECAPADFCLPVKKEATHVNVRVIDQVTDLVTKERILSVPVIQGEIRSNVREDILKVAAIDRRHVPGKTFVGLIKGFRLRAGAIACSAPWDISDIIVVGENDADMAGAVNRVHALQGGIVVFANGDVIAEIPLPIFGLIADVPISELVQRIEEIKRAVRDLGVPFDDPLLTLMTLTSAAIPFFNCAQEALKTSRS